ncbi:conserved hypothetical protein [Leishmania infantum JPCM5]|uniref:MYCBP-associated_protein_family_-_putative n=2 Tax=Leishmania infantum TaxID=5671 RepID=A0A6L0XE26_LEIIN|nr:conserved hypothetical protein [Leishmania infantum JPCM5]CAC9489391.1 MYCBP-associated_protein_family_-_putative [Leishmania infantum]CAM68175.1 conserved hypothetical protein [Leishmania infantum JPCM5]SUZ41946.1 MYCBP-associated_protein_family_-_putative [Leishmania infantum]|eukprot:XP_001465748.1 conserved hypothetical protein [Leishmania infantum JPCM5]
METRADMVRRGPAHSGRAAPDLYDERQRQTKALALWERQKAAWARMQTHLTSANTASSSAANNGHRHEPSSTVSFSHTFASAGTGGAATARNFIGATTAARAKREDFGMLAVAQPQTANDGSHVWEGLLRCTDARSSRRLVPIGRTSFPYQLYSEARDPTTLPEDHMTYTRVVSKEDVAAVQNTTTRSHRSLDLTMKRVEQRATAQSRVLAAMMEAVADASGGTTESEVAYIGRQGEKGGDAVSYYESQLRRLAPYVQKRLGHFLQPRTFLHVEGHSAPCASAEELEVQKHEWADARPSSAPPVEYFPPPPQTQMWASIPTTTAPSLMASTLQPAGTARKQKGLNSVASGSAHSYGPSVPEHSKDRSDRADGENAFADEVDSMTECLPCGTVCTATPSELPCDTPVGSIDGDVHEKRARTTQVAKRGISQRHQQSRTEAGAEHGDNMQSSGPAMEMSTRSLFFQTRPHELLQGTVTLCNTGTTTIYFSWVPVDTIEEQLRQLDQDSGAAAAADSKAAESGEVREKGANKEHRQTLSDRDGTDATRITHSLAVHQRTARETFFFLSSPMNGVVLPGEEGIFAFSVRANRAGLFQHTYELLTVPPAPERIFVCLRALVQSDGPSFEWLAAPVAEAIEAKVTLDTQRRLVQTISMNVDAIEGSALSTHIKALDGASEAATAAERKRRRAQEDAWNLANRFTFDHIPYAAAVYDKLVRLYTVVQETCRTLSRKQNAKTGAAPENAAVATAAAALDARTKPFTSHAALPAPAPPPQQEPVAPTADIVATASGPAQWDGSLLLLMKQMMAVRDAPTRQTFFEAFLVLLRAARASRQCNSCGGGTEGEEQETLPLPVLLARAATALADRVRGRRAAMLEKECEDMLGQKVAPAATPFMQAFAAASGTSITRETVGGTAGGSQSVNSRKRNVSTRGRSGETTVGDGVACAGGADASALGVTEATKAQRVVLDSIPAEELLSFSAIQPIPKALAALETAEKAAVRAQRESDLAAERSSWIELYTTAFLEVIDAACDRGPLSACTAARLAELEDIQMSALLPIDLSADPIIPLTTGKGGKRK